MNNKKYKIDVTHIVFLSFIVPLLLFSLFNTSLSILNESYKINDRLLLFASLYAISFSLFTSSYVKGKIKTVGLFILPVLVFFLVLLAIKYKVDLNGLNNSLSLIALSISIIILPFRTLQEVVDKELNIKNIKEISDLKKQIEQMQNSEKEQAKIRYKHIKEIIDNAHQDRNYEAKEKLKVIEQNLELIREVDLLNVRLEEAHKNMRDLDRHFNYEKNEMQNEYENAADHDAIEIENLKKKIIELKEQKEDA